MYDATVATLSPRLEKGQSGCSYVNLCSAEREREKKKKHKEIALKRINGQNDGDECILSETGLEQLHAAMREPTVQYVP